MFINLKVSDVFRQYVIIIIANFGILFVGMEVAWISPALVKLRDANQTTLSRPITEKEGAWIASIAPLCGLPAIFVMGYLIDNFGRKRTMTLAIIPRIAMCVINIIANEPWMLLVARALCGLSEVISLTVVFPYACEIASKEIRGALGTFTQVLSALGMLIMLSVGPFVSYLTMNIVYSAIYLLSLLHLFLPESPYFLYMQGRKEESLKVLTSIRKSEAIAREEMKDYSMNDVAIDKLELLKDKTVLKTIGKVIFLSIFFQLVGYNAVSAYLQTILESTNTSLKPEIASVVIGSIQLLASFCTVFLTDRFGRKPILAVTLFGMAVGMTILESTNTSLKPEIASVVIGSIHLLASFCTVFLTDRFGRKPILTVTLFGMAVGMVGLGAFFQLTEKHVQITGALNFLPLVSLILVIYCFNAGLGSIMWMLVAELFDGPSRSLGVSIGIFFTTLFIFITTNTFSSIISIIGSAATYWIFAGNCIIICFFILFFIPETKGKSFSEIQEVLGRTKKKDSRHPN